MLAKVYSCALIGSDLRAAGRQLPKSRAGGGDRRLSGGHAGPAGRALFTITHPIEPYHTDLNLDDDPPPYASDFQDIKG